MSVHLASDQARAFAEWWGEGVDADPYSKAAFFAGWQASKADSHNHKVVVEYDLAPAFIEGNLRDKLIELGWSPPGSGVKYYYEAPDKTCRCGLNPSGCNMGCDV